MKRFLLITATLFAMSFSGAIGHIFLKTLPMPTMGKQMSQGHCQSSCGVQSAITLPGNKIEVGNQEAEPQPVEAHRLIFSGVGWTAVLGVGALYFFDYLCWRPPDIFRLHANYRF